VQPEIGELQPKLKEILYDCAIEIRATKAALYLFNGTDRFELAGEYGFRSAARQTATENDPLIDRCLRGRNAFFINGLTSEPRFSEFLYEAATDRLLAAPLYLRGQLVGVIDMRDKAAKLPFESTDLPKAQAIAERIVNLFANTNVFRQRFITLSSYPEPPGIAAKPGAAQPRVPPASAVAAVVDAPPPPSGVAPAPPPPKPPQQSPAQKAAAEIPAVADVILQARTAAAKHLSESEAEPAALTESSIAGVRSTLRAIVRLPGAVVAAFSAFGHLDGIQEIAARAPLSDEALSLLRSRLAAWLQSRGDNSGIPAKANVIPTDAAASPVAAAELKKVVTAPVVASSLRGLVLTVAFDDVPNRATQELLEWFLIHLQSTIEQTASGSAPQLRRRMAEKLLEPDFQRFPALRRHSEQVASLAERFARYIGLSGPEVEAIWLTGMLHDAGMRLLDYEHVYRGQDLGADEIAVVREHPTVGAAIAAPLFGADIAQAILCHHERVDGRGYPNQKSGLEVPLASRIIQLCDAFVSMSDPESYQPAQPLDVVLATIDVSAGTQFDEALVRRFKEMKRTR
jgi:hypothetical protein